MPLQGHLIEHTGKQASEIPSAVWGAAVGQDISKVVLSKNMLREVPEPLFDFAGTLTILDLSFNKLTALPDDIAGKCTHIK